MCYLIPIGKLTFSWLLANQTAGSVTAVAELLGIQCLAQGHFSRVDAACWHGYGWIWVCWLKDVVPFHAATALLLRFCCVGVFVSTGVGANFSWSCTAAVAADLGPQSQTFMEKNSLKCLGFGTFSQDPPKCFSYCMAYLTFLSTQSTNRNSWKPNLI